MPKSFRSDVARKSLHDKANFSGTSVFSRPKSEFQVKWSVHDFRVHIAPENGYAKLTEPERIEVVNNILAKVRSRSEHPEISSAAMAITQSGQMFVANNTQKQHKFHKDCAEVNAINIITQLVGAKEKISRLYLMMGFGTPGKDTAPDKLERPFAPCGKCLDALSSCSTPEAMITMLPANDGTLPITLNLNAHHVDELKAGEAWHTPLSNLLIDKVIDLSVIEKKHAVAGWQALVKNPPTVQKLSEKDIGRLFVSKRKLTDEEQKIKALIIKAGSNAAMRRESEAELDIDHSPEGINRFMVRRIKDAYYKRSLVEDASGEHVADVVRCVVVRLADGTFHKLPEVDGDEENAVTPAGITVVSSTDYLREYITDVWVMRVCKKDVEQGKLYTSPREELERIYKRRAKVDGITDLHGKPVNGSINMHYISFNDGMLNSNEVDDITRRYAIEDLYTSRFKGSRYYGKNGNGNGAGIGH